MASQKQAVKTILLAPDKFKGSLSSTAAAQAIIRGFSRFAGLHGLEFQYEALPVADGGDGSLEVVRNFRREAREVRVSAHDAAGNPVRAKYLLLGDGRAFIEMADICGLARLDPDRRDPLLTSTYGLGETIRDALHRGVRRIWLSIGGSATNDAGAGMLQALGYIFRDREGKELAVPVRGGDLSRIASVERPAAGSPGENLSLQVVCDVDNPLLGPHGATYVYAPQKGAGRLALEFLEQGMQRFAAVAERFLDVPQSIKDLPGAGAAGGVGFAGVAVLGGSLLSGWKFFSGMAGVAEKLHGAALAVTGEGRLDGQSLQGKVVGSLAAMARREGIPVAVFCGTSLLEQREREGLRIYELSRVEPDLNRCIRNAADVLEETAFRAAPELLGRL